MTAKELDKRRLNALKKYGHLESCSSHTPYRKCDCDPSLKGTRI